MYNTHREKFSGVLFGLFQIINILGITPWGPPTLKWITFAALTWISFHLITRTTTGDPIADLGLGSAILSQLFIVINFMVLTDPNSLQNFQDSHRGKITEMPFKQRVVWAINLYTNPRGIGWAHASRHLPSSPSPSIPRWKFVRVRILRALLYIMVECVVYVLNASNPGLTTPGALLSDFAFCWRALGAVAFGAAGFARINLINCLLSAGMVGCGLSTPERWPYLFGSPLQAWNVQQFWRKVWHQMLRKPAIGCASFTTSKIIRLNTSAHGRQSNLSNLAHNFLWLYTVFFIVGFIHIGGEYMLLGRFGSSAFKFFMLQPVAITLEKVVASGWTYFNPPLNIDDGSVTPKKRQNRHNGVGLSPNNGKRSRSSHKKTTSEPPIWLRCVGYVWVFFWFVWSLTLMIDPMVPLGVFIDPRVDFRTFVWTA